MFDKISEHSSYKQILAASVFIAAHKLRATAPPPQSEPALWCALLDATMRQSRHGAVQHNGKKGELTLQPQIDELQKDVGEPTTRLVLVFCGLVTTPFA